MLGLTETEERQQVGKEDVSEDKGCKQSEWIETDTRGDWTGRYAMPDFGPLSRQKD